MYHIITTDAGGKRLEIEKADTKAEASAIFQATIDFLDLTGGESVAIHTSLFGGPLVEHRRSAQPDDAKYNWCNRPVFRKPGRPVSSRCYARSVTINDETVEILTTLGNGNLSAGIRKAADILAAQGFSPD